MAIKGLNRTFMELKQDKNGKPTTTVLSLNRTFMELKPGQQLLFRWCQRVLIAPLWN